MHRLMRSGLLLSGLVLAGVARADDKAPHPGPPKPPQALVDAFQGMAGTWSCRANFGSGAPESKSTMVVKPVANGFGYSGEVIVEGSAMMPSGVKQELTWAYNQVTHKLVEFIIDSFGDVESGTSDGMNGDTTVWEEDAVMMGKVWKSRTTVKRVGPKEVALTFETQKDGTWSAWATKTCKKH
jgi:hypothetical protein